MKKLPTIILTILALTLATLACSLVSGLTPSRSEKVLFQDNFEGNIQNWGTGTDTNSSAEYNSGGLRFQVFQPHYFIWSNFNDTNYTNIRIEVTVKNNSADPASAYGIICYQGVNDEDMYYSAIAANGNYAIARGESGNNVDFFFTNDDQWGVSDLIPVNADSYRLGMECGNGQLKLFVNGRQIDSAQDSSYSSGRVALFAWSTEDENSADVTFDDFIITALP